MSTAQTTHVSDLRICANAYTCTHTNRSPTPTVAPNHQKRPSLPPNKPVCINSSTSAKSMPGLSFSRCSTACSEVTCVDKKEAGSRKKPQGQGARGEKCVSTPSGIRNDLHVSCCCVSLLLSVSTFECQRAREMPHLTSVVGIKAMPRRLGQAFRC